MTLPGPLIAYKIGALALIAVATFLLVTNHLRHVRAEGYQAGVEACQADGQKALTKANEANAKASTDLQATIDDQARRIAQLSVQRQAREQVIVTRIEEALPAQPNCQITPELLTLRNQIRSQ